MVTWKGDMYGAGSVWVAWLYTELFLGNCGPSWSLFGWNKRQLAEGRIRLLWSLVIQFPLVVALWSNGHNHQGLMLTALGLW